MRWPKRSERPFGWFEWIWWRSPLFYARSRISDKITDYMQAHPATDRQRKVVALMTMLSIISSMAAIALALVTLLAVR